MPIRQAVISLPIPQAAHLERFEAVERLSELFSIRAEVICEEAEVDFLPHLGEAALITVAHEDGGAERAFSGLIYEAEFVEEVEAGFRYVLTLRPWLYALSRNLDFKIFQNKTVIDIIEAVFNARGCSDFDTGKLQHTGRYLSRDYCVQYQESDFTFLSRLMEEEGIYYYFEHQGGRHTMVLCDDANSHPLTPGGALPYIAVRQAAVEDRFWRWTERVVSGAETKSTLRSYDFTKPTTNLESNYTKVFPQAAAGGREATSRIAGRVGEEAPTGHAAKAIQAEVYDYPGTYDSASRGSNLSEVIVRAIHRQLRSYRGEGDVLALACGHKMDILGHPLTRLDQTYLVNSIVYRVEAEQYVSGGGGGAEQSLVVEITATPAADPWSAPKVTPKTLARGPETAVVVGPSGETLYTDKYGRVKVRFYWDRGEQSSDSTCWIRVSDSSADGGFGHVVLPRIGQEVVVDFLNGDPDQPLIVGRVYNAAKMPPYTLPDHKDRSVWRSHTIKGGADDYNEISMLDTSGSEEMKVQAQKDRNTLIKNDDTKTVKNNETTTIENDRTLTVDKGNQSHTLKMGNMSVELKMGNSTTDLKMGNYGLKADLGAITIEAMQSITLKVGQSSIKLDQMGVTIQGMMVSSEAQIQNSTKGLMTQISGDAMTTVKGGIIMIN
jgi:type VI secretion system secreted protein VgrG